MTELVERCCAEARRSVAGVGSVPGAEVLNDVLNEVLLAVSNGRTGDDETDAALAALADAAEGPA